MVKIQDKALWINGKKELIVSGEVHYYRLEKSDWQDRIAKLKESGCNAVASYIPWICHEEEEGVFLVEGPRVERMLGYTNLESEKGFDFFQKFMKENGILEQLEELGIEEGDTVKLYNLEFEYYR